MYATSTAQENHLGFLTATFAGHQWYANRSTSIPETFRLWYSDPDDPEAVDTTQDGTWLEIPSVGSTNDPVVGMAPCYNGLLVFKQNETFLLSGTTPEDFTLRKVMDDGLISTMGLVTYASGAIWPGQNGIYYYKGIGEQYLEQISVVNIAEEKLGPSWQQAIADFDAGANKMWGMLAHDHYFLFIEKYDSVVPVVKGSTQTTQTNTTLVVNLITGAVTFMSNLPIRGGVQLPLLDGVPTFYLVNDSTQGHINTSHDLLYTQGQDVIQTDVGTLGPDYYFESKKFAMEDPLILKRFKQLTIHHNNDGGRLKCDVIPGLNEDGTTLTSTLQDTAGVWEVHRLRFSKKTQFFSFKIYQEDSNIDSLNLGPFQIRYKALRPGRV